MMGNGSTMEIQFHFFYNRSLGEIKIKQNVLKKRKKIQEEQPAVKTSKIEDAFSELANLKKENLRLKKLLIQKGR